MEDSEKPNDPSSNGLSAPPFSPLDQPPEPWLEVPSLPLAPDLPSWLELPLSETAIDQGLDAPPNTDSTELSRSSSYLGLGIAVDQGNSIPNSVADQTPLPELPYPSAESSEEFRPEESELSASPP